MSAGEKLKGWIRGRKDTSVSFLLQKMAQKHLEPYGTLDEFRIDSVRRTASFQLRLKGELEPLSVSVLQYELASQSDGDYIIVQDASTSREWLTSAVRDFVLGRPFRIPDEYSSYVKMVL